MNFPEIYKLQIKLDEQAKEIAKLKGIISIRNEYIDQMRKVFSDSAVQLRIKKKRYDEIEAEIETLKAEIEALKNPWIEISAFSQNPEPESKVLVADKIGHIHKAKYLPNGCYSIYGVRLEKAELLRWMPLPKGSK